MVTLSYKSPVDRNLLEISPAVKNNDTGNWDCEVFYESAPLVFCTPKLKINEGGLLFKIQNKKRFMEFIETIETSIVDFLSKTPKVFKGKVFSSERLTNCLEPCFSIDENGTVNLHTSFDENLSCFDLFDEKIEYNKIGENVMAIIHLKKISFTRDLFKIKYVVKSLKMTKPEKINVNFEDQEEIEKIQPPPTLDDPRVDENESFFE